MIIKEKASATGFLTAGIFIYMVLISLKFKYLVFLNAITLSVALQGGSLLWAAGSAPEIQF